MVNPIGIPPRRRGGLAARFGHRPPRMPARRSTRKPVSGRRTTSADRQIRVRSFRPETAPGSVLDEALEALAGALAGQPELGTDRAP
jgi:hypothetical protein